jgi:hypothetical protein
MYTTPPTSFSPSHTVFLPSRPGSYRSSSFRYSFVLPRKCRPPSPRTERACGRRVPYAPQKEEAALKRLIDSLQGGVTFFRVSAAASNSLGGAAALQVGQQRQLGQGLPLVVARLEEVVSAAHFEAIRADSGGKKALTELLRQAKMSPADLRKRLEKVSSRLWLWLRLRLRLRLRWWQQMLCEPSPLAGFGLPLHNLTSASIVLVCLGLYILPLRRRPRPPFAQTRVRILCSRVSVYILPSFFGYPSQRRAHAPCLRRTRSRQLYSGASRNAAGEHCRARQSAGSSWSSRSCCVPRVRWGVRLPGSELSAAVRLWVKQ